MKISDFQKLLKTRLESPQLLDSLQLQQLMRANGIDPRNLYQELEMDSRYVNTHQDTSFSNSSMQLHSHNFYELLCCRNTCGVEYLVGSRRYRLQKGDIILVGPGISHRPILPEHMTVAYKRDVLWISQEFAELILNMLNIGTTLPDTIANLLRTAGTRWEFLEGLFRKGVVEAEAKAEGWELAVMGNTMTLVAHLSRAFRDQDSPPLQAEQPELLDQIMGYVENNYREKMLLRDLARQFYVSESTITHAFRQKLGVSFHHYVTQRRLISAKELILRGDPLETISSQVGFGDYSAFYRAFRQEFGISPKQFKSISGK